MAASPSHVLQAFLAKGRITDAEYREALNDPAKFNALVARVAIQNGGK